MTNNGSYNPRNFSFKYYGSNWTGGSAANIKTFNISKVIKKGFIATTVVGTIEVGQGVAKIMIITKRLYTLTAKIQQLHRVV